MSIKAMRLLVFGFTTALSILLYYCYKDIEPLSIILVGKILFQAFCIGSFLAVVIDELILLKKRKT